MMKLLSSLPSPFGRKVKIVAKMKGLDGDIEMQHTDTNTPNAALRKENPLHKIPVLILADGTRLYDSHVICEYLDTLKPSPRLFPAAGRERFRTLTMGALGDGLLEAALLLVYEKRFRPEDKWVQGWVERQQSKVDTALDYLEAAPPAWSESPDYGHVTLACALGYLDFRHEGKWRAGHPRLVAWLDKFAAAVPAFAQTKPA
jgi:glutathione S-transferase